MNFLLFAFLLFQAATPPKAIRIEKITFDRAGQITLSVQEGEIGDAGFVKSGTKLYSIDLAAAEMKQGGEVRNFSPGEAFTVNLLLDALAQYAVESTIRFIKGGGEPAETKPALKSERYPAGDGCNYCTKHEDGSESCTLAYCGIMHKQIGP